MLSAKSVESEYKTLKRSPTYLGVSRDLCLTQMAGIVLNYGEHQASSWEGSLKLAQSIRTREGDLTGFSSSEVCDKQ